MKYEFTREQLLEIEDWVPFESMDFPRAAYRFYHNLRENAELDVREVEDFAIDFMTQYNKKIYTKF